MPLIIHDYYGDGHAYASDVTEYDRPTHSKLLGPDGKPLQYAPKEPVGFKLTRSEDKP